MVGSENKLEWQRDKVEGSLAVGSFYFFHAY